MRLGEQPHAAQLRSYAEREDGEIPLSVLADEEARALSRTVAARGMVRRLRDRAPGPVSGLLERFGRTPR